ncbi:hypothetical protein EG329_001202 [Mollisiaceae sp. DMI_Dod_QoI]|nr:hypothetical protein EG329_001202 [Helotiales sp. DMI_Dod_QoI]
MAEIKTSRTLFGLTTARHAGFWTLPPTFAAPRLELKKHDAQSALSKSSQYRPRGSGNSIHEQQFSVEPLVRPLLTAAMIWYLLYPLRRTANPPTLGVDHVLRRWIYYLGTVFAQHSLATIAITVAIGVCLCVPVPFIYHPTSSLASPTQTDTRIAADPSPNGIALIPDIFIKQVWIHNGWMKALERDTLLTALAVQDLLLGSIPSCATTPWHEYYNVRTPAGSNAPKSGTPVSFFHSPLLYWNCSVGAIESDESIVSTINSHAHQISPANVTLRPLSVLAGTISSSNTVVAADALVISLFYKDGSQAGDLWDLQAETLIQQDKSRWEVHLATNKRPKSMLIKVHSQSNSTRDKAIFLSGCILIALSIVFKLRHTTAMKSKVGLFIAIALQGLLSVISGMTVAAWLHIDISKIPLAACPFIIFIVGLENMFRLINEVEKRPLQDQSLHQVATALGAVGHISLIAVAQYLVIFWLLSRIASPGLAAFFRFAAISLTIDLAFFFTFFVAILAMSRPDYGLQDSFQHIHLRAEEHGDAKVAPVTHLPQPQGRYAKQHPRQSTLPYLHLMCAVIVISIISILARRFIEGSFRSHLARMFAVVFNQSGFMRAGYSWQDGISKVEESRAKMDWLNMLEQETTREILHLANPQSPSFLVRLYDPLVVGLKSAGRNGSQEEDMFLSSPMSGFLFRQFEPPVVLLCCVLMLLSVIRKCSSSNDGSDEMEGRISKGKAISMVNYLPRGHSLDVFMLAASSKQYLVSVGFDHEIRAWNLESQNRSSRLITPVSESHILWPAVAIAVDDKAEWIAICSKAGGISLWDIKLQSFRRSIDLGLNSRIVACFFTPSTYLEGLRPATRLLIVFASGSLADVDIETGSVLSHQICSNPLRSSHVSSHRRMPLRLITISKDEKINITVKREGSWTSQALHFSIPILKSPARLRFSIIPDLRMIGLVLNVDTHQLHLIDFLSGAAIYTFRNSSFKHRTLRAIHSPPQQCLSCGAVALASFSIAYTTEEDGSFIMRTLTADQNARIRTGLICLRAERDLRERRCIGFGSGVEKLYSIPNPGVWETTAANGVAGVRRKEQKNPEASPNAFSGDRTFFRRRERTSQSEHGVDEAWEAWTMTAKGVINIHPIKTNLFTSRVGPLCSIGRNAIAVGLAEGIALVQFGSQLHDNDDNDDDNVSVRRVPRSRPVGRLKSGF